MRLTYGISTRYVNHWGVWEALRELAQNCYDNNGEVVIENGRMGFVNSNTVLPNRYLLLGEGDKVSGDDSRGMFGEGMKLAMMVLLRSRKGIEVNNGGDVWKPGLVWDDSFDCEVFSIEVEEEGGEVSNASSFSIFISGLTIGECKTFEENVLQMGVGYEDPIESGSILTGRNSGKLFIGGLYVGGEECNYGYDFPPDKIKVGRDRNELDVSKVRGLMAECLREDIGRSRDRWGEVAELLEAGSCCEDVVYLPYQELPDEFLSFLWDRFSTVHTDTLPVYAEWEKSDMVVKYPDVRCTIVSERLRDLLKKSIEYQEFVDGLNVAEPEEKVWEMLGRLLEKYRGVNDGRVYDELDEILFIAKEREV